MSQSSVEPDTCGAKQVWSLFTVHGWPDEVSRTNNTAAIEVCNFRSQFMVHFAISTAVKQDEPKQ